MDLAEAHEIFLHDLKGPYLSLTSLARKKTGIGGESVHPLQGIARLLPAISASERHTLYPYEVPFITHRLVSDQFHPAGHHILNSPDKSGIEPEESHNVTLLVIDDAVASGTADHPRRENVIDPVFTEKEPVEASSAYKGSISRKHPDSFLVFKSDLILTKETGVSNVKS
ncbi:MAG: hypothetical protein GXX82_05950 [Syntrophorhabdus sp.]|nr:hypothetical protein [Syntrophorhabdus sp.]